MNTVMIEILVSDAERFASPVIADDADIRLSESCIAALSNIKENIVETKSFACAAPDQRFTVFNAQEKEAWEEAQIRLTSVMVELTIEDAERLSYGGWVDLDNASPRTIVRACQSALKPVYIARAEEFNKDRGINDG